MTRNLPSRALIAAAALAWACTPPAPAGAPGAAAPLSGKTLAGKTASLSDYKGKVVLVDFWATWCGPCREEIPGLVELQARLGAKGLAVLGVSMDEDVAEVGPFVEKMRINYPIILNGGESAPAGWAVPGLPTAYLISRDGKVLLRQFGSKSIDKLAADVEAALAK
ncbi:MAG: TlpA family protein disulfide reductase [Elusimicrobia bacterium]|nr:TlpA family protein disulfide reductase [Elusimicrobiota bacterium]